MYTTRSGRLSKPPQRYEPKEQVIDDFDEEGEESDEESDSDSSDEEDADEHGNLNGFVTYDDDE